MGTGTATRRTAPNLPGPAVLCAGLALTGGLLLTACGGDPAPTAAPASPTPTVSAADRAYCDTVARVQAQQSSPQAGQGGVIAASASARRQVDDLIAAAPAELAADWRNVGQLTEQALDSLAGTGGDPGKIDRDELAKLQAQSRPAVDRIKAATEQRCHVAFRAPG